MADVKLRNMGQYGVITDRHSFDLPLNAWSYARNVRFQEEGAGQVTGENLIYNVKANPAQAGTTPYNVPNWTMQFPPSDNPIWCFGDVNELWAMDVNGSVHRITRDSGLYQGDPSLRWQGHVFNGVGVLNNGVDTPQQWTIQLQNKAEDLSNWPSGVTAECVKSFRYHLIALNLVDNGSSYPWRIRWSNIADPGAVPADWDVADPSSNAGQRDLTDSPGELVDQMQLGTQNIIYKTDQIWTMDFVGRPAVFRTVPIMQVGALTRDCVAPFPQGHVVVTSDDIIYHNGLRDSHKSILRDRIRKSLFKTIDPTYFYLCQLAVNFPQKEIWFCYPEPGADKLTRALLWNYEDGSISYRDLPGCQWVSSGSVYAELSALTWGE